MHELGLAIDLVDVASETLSRLGPVKVKAVRLRLGPLAGVVKEALLFSFEAAATGTRLEGARLRIEDVPATAWCGVCEAERELVDAAIRRCPICQAPTPRLIRGDELQVLGLEVEDA
jgi:hydrogenase nickel incorporation protein HypA/HybF